MLNPIVILGCTASGKSDLGEGIAARLGADVIAVDSMQVYRGMDIGTAKPPADVRARVPYFMLDVADPWESFSAARFVETAEPLVEERVRAGRPVVLIAGTILYLRALVEGLFEGPSADPAIRQELAERAKLEGALVLHGELARIDPAAAGRIHPNDLRRIVRALEVYRLTGKPITELQTQWAQARGAGPFADALFVGIRREKDVLSRRINARVRKMVELGLVEEVRQLAEDARGFSEEAASAVGYKQLLAHFQRKCSLDEAIEQVKIQTRYLAKMQRTWLKRWPSSPPFAVRWLDAQEGVEGADLIEPAMALVDSHGKGSA